MVRNGLKGVLTMSTQTSGFSMCFLQTVLVLLAASILVACKTTESTGLRDYSNGINVAVAADAKNPAYVIGESTGAAGYGYAYMLEKSAGRWRVMYDSYDAKAFAKQAGEFKEVPTGTEVLWTDGKNVAVYFGTEPLTFSKKDGTFSCPKEKTARSHRACRSLLSETSNVFDGLKVNDNSRAFILDFNKIKRVVEQTGIVMKTKNRMAREK